MWYSGKDKTIVIENISVVVRVRLGLGRVCDYIGLVEEVF